MSTVVLDTITGKSTATTITIGSTPVVSASANSMTIRGEGSAQTSIQQGLIKAWAHNNAAGTSIEGSFNIASLTDTSAGVQRNTFTSAMSNATYSAGLASESSSASVSQWIEEINSARYDTRHYNGSAYVDCITLSHVQGDLA